MYSLVFTQRAAVRERLPAEAAGVGALPGVDTYMDLLGTARAKYFACN